MFCTECQLKLQRLYLITARNIYTNNSKNIKSILLVNMILPHGDRNKHISLILILIFVFSLIILSYISFLVVSCNEFSYIV